MKEAGKRKIEKLSDDTVILTDTSNGKVTKTKLVRLYPKELFWTSTHISGPLKHSQFLYRIAPEGKNRSRLDFVGRQLESRMMTKSEARALARKVRKEDSAAWKYLAKALDDELSK
jgi:hypothetical protein